MILELYRHCSVFTCLFRSWFNFENKISRDLDERIKICPCNKSQPLTAPRYMRVSKTMKHLIILYVMVSYSSLLTNWTPTSQLKPLDTWKTTTYGIEIYVLARDRWKITTYTVLYKYIFILIQNRLASLS